MRRGLDQALDDYLVLLAQGGSQEAFARLAVRWTPKLIAFASRSIGTEAAGDVVQETWESAWRNLRLLGDPARFHAWIFSIAARKCADALRAKYRHGRIEERARSETREAHCDAEGEAGVHMDMAKAIKHLPREQRIAVSLYFGEDLDLAEIARITGVPPGTVKSRLFAARKALRASLGEKR